MDYGHIARLRCAAQGLAEPLAAGAGALVGHFGAVQAQEYLGATWSLGMRLVGAREAAIDAAYDAGEIIRLHILRPTWHFVAPEDVRWLLALTAPRVHAANAARYRDLELDATTLERAADIISAAVAGGHYRTRPEIAAILANSGIVAEGQRLGYILHYAELNARICSGPRRGKQHTHALLDERAAPGRERSREEALAEIVMRYLGAHGPATAADIAWWSGLTISDIKAGLALNSQALEVLRSGDKEYWMGATTKELACPAATLLHTFDEYLVGYAQFERARRGRYPAATPMVHQAVFLLDGMPAGTWKRTLSAKSVRVEFAPYGVVSSAEREALAAAAAAYAQFLGLELVLSAG